MAQAARGMAGIDFLRGVRDGTIQAAPIQELIGMKLAEVEPGRAVWEVVPAEQHYNPIGTVHAGITATLLDSAMACAVHSSIPLGKGYTTLEFKINLVRAVAIKTGELRATGKVVHAFVAAATFRTIEIPEVVRAGLERYRNSEFGFAEYRAAVEEAAKVDPSAQEVVTKALRRLEQYGATDEVVSK